LAECAGFVESIFDDEFGDASAFRFAFEVGLVFG
jgi:hypothetical protein